MSQSAVISVSIFSNRQSQQTMFSVLLVLVCQFQFGFGARTNVLLIGAGNCDVSDTACRQLPDPAEHKVSVFNADGLGVLPSKIAVGGESLLVHPTLRERARACTLPLVPDHLVFWRSVRA